MQVSLCTNYKHNRFFFITCIKVTRNSEPKQKGDDLFICYIAMPYFLEFKLLQKKLAPFSRCSLQLSGAEEEISM